jgi:hypothetical protein
MIFTFSQFEVFENINLAKSLLSGPIIDEIIEADPSPSKKYTGWIAKILKELGDPDQISWLAVLSNIKSQLIKYDQLVQANKINRRDIYSFKSLAEFEKYFDSLSDLSTNSSHYRNYEVISNTDDYYIVCPYNHSTARKLGFSNQFSTRENEVSGKIDSGWCITFRNKEEYWDYHYYGLLQTFYFVNFKKEKSPYDKVVFAVDPINEQTMKLTTRPRVEMFNSIGDLDNQIGRTLIKKYDIKNLLISRRLKERFEHSNIIEDGGTIANYQNGDKWNQINRTKQFFPSLFYK